MSQDKSQTRYLKSVLEKDKGSNKLGVAQATDTLEQVEHYLRVKNPKKAQKMLEKFTRQLIELIRG